MTRFLIVSLTGGFLFGVLDALINANPLARRLYEFYKPIVRTSLNPLTGIVIDLVYGFVLAGAYLLLCKSLPGESGLVKGFSFGVLVWFFRVAMSVASQWVMFNISIQALVYTLVSGLVEMLLLGVLFGLALNPIE